MLGRWLFVRIRAAERALHEGRIDEAYAVAAQADVRAHRRGQKLLDELVRPLVARARLHAQAGRYSEAVDDLDRLKAVGRGGPEVDELRRRAAEHLRDRRQRDVQRHDAYARAAADLGAGRLESGRLEIERVDDPAYRENLREQLDIRVERSTQLLAQAGEALEREDVLAALRFWREAGERHGRSRASDEFAARLGPAYRRALNDWFGQGRLERLMAARDGLAVLREFDPTLEEVEQIAALCARSAAQLGSRDYAGLRESLLRLKAARPQADWIESMLGALAQLGAAHDTLLASPVGLLASSAGQTAPIPPGRAGATGQSAAAGAETRPVRDAPGPGAAAVGVRPLLLLVDGAGSSLLVPQDCVRIGRAGGSRPVDVPIPAELQSHHADIVRDGEDYFLTAHGPAHVNQREVKRTLLRDGDRIVLGSAVKLVFRQPSARSASAVLRLSHRCRLAQDVSDVVLFHDTCLIGAQASCHVRTAEGDTQVVLFERGGRLCGREAASGGGKLGDVKPLALGATLDFGDVRVTIKTYEGPDPGRTVT